MSVKTNKPMHDAFSLVELSIVLVILGLLAGGVLSGQSLIRAAELRGVVTDYQRFVTATQTFRDKYLALPGDMANATKFWGAADADAATCAITASTDKKTCDGNGDGMVAPIGLGVMPMPGSDEPYRFWQHLANAGLIEGSYDGTYHGTTIYSSTVANSPRGKISNTIWFVWNWTAPVTGGCCWFYGEYGNRLSVGSPAANAEPIGRIFKAEEAWSIDTKLDDAKPARGKVRVPSNGADCVDQEGGTVTPASLNAKYNLQGTARDCFVIFPEAF